MRLPPHCSTTLKLQELRACVRHAQTRTFQRLVSDSVKMQGCKLWLARYTYSSILVFQSP